MKDTVMKFAGIFILSGGLSVTLFGQTAEELINLYNEGAKVASTNTKAAIDSFTKVIGMCEQVTDTAAAKVCQLARTQLPALQFKYATELYTSQKLDSAITNFERALQFSEIYGDVQTKGKAIDNLSKLYLSLGNSFYKADDFTIATINLDKALSFNPKYPRAFLTKGMIFKKQNNTEAMKDAMDKAIAFATEAADEKTANAAKKTMKDFYLVKANDAAKAKSFKTTLEMLDISKVYDDTDPNLYYLYAVAYNNLSEWDNAIASAQKGIELEANTSEARAKFYFELGNAQLGKNDKTAACSAYKNAKFGSFVEQAKYQIETVLKCN
jgi:tetratricopeptide (TPR) repeat protein